jgi:quercetin dioxygenase-like cupin family protein
MRVIRQDELPPSNIARELNGHEHADVGVSIIFVDAPPGRGPSLHKHPYEEILIVQEGEATFQLEGSERVVRAGEIVIVAAGEWHGFVNSGDAPLRQVNIHVSPRMITEWLSD